MHHKNCKYLVGIKITKCHYSPFSHKYDQEDTSETCTSVRLCYGLWIYLCVCLREEEMSKDFLCRAGALVQLCRTFSPTKSQWLKEYGMLISMCLVVFWNWKQIYVVLGISSLKVALNTLVLLSKPCSLLWSRWFPANGFTTHGTDTWAAPAPPSWYQEFPIPVTPGWHLVSSIIWFLYKALGVFPFKKKKNQTNTFWSPELLDSSLQPQAQPQNKMPWHGINMSRSDRVFLLTLITGYTGWS